MPNTIRGVLLAAAVAALHCNFVVDFKDCTSNRECALGERCNAARGYCEVPAVELCNGVDDDHDGVADDAEDFGPCLVAPRPPMCRDGRRRCVGGQLACVVRAAPASTDVCHNGVDDNCNGVVDDGAACVQNYPASTDFPIGSDTRTDGEGDDAPLHRVCIGGFSIDRYEVSNDAFLAWLNTLDASRFMVGTPPRPLNATVPYGSYVLYNEGTPQAPNWVPLVAQPQPVDAGYALSIRRRGALFETLAADAGMLPVSNVTWLAADRYCRAAGKHLPTEAEFFRAMRDDMAARTYPWGNNAPTCQLANIAVNGTACVGRPLPVTALPMGRSPDGVFNLYGNVDEWMWDYLDDSPNHDRNNYYQAEPMGGWCAAYPNGPTGPTMGAPLNDSPTVQRCTRCRFSRGRRYDSTDPRILIRKWMDADRAEPGIGFRCSTGGADR